MKLPIGQRVKTVVGETLGRFAGVEEYETATSGRIEAGNEVTMPARVVIGAESAVKLF
jgi:hypothetical protein